MTVRIAAATGVPRVDGKRRQESNQGDGPRGEPGDGSTPNRILWALTELVLEGGLSHFSVQEVADRAGVSHRTVYRHFPTREALLSGIVEWVEDDVRRLGGGDGSGGTETLAEQVAKKFEIFDDIRDPMEAAIRFAIGCCLSAAPREQRTSKMRRQVGEILEGVNEREVELVFAAVRLLASSRAWLTMREDSNLGGVDAGLVSAWAIRTLIKAAVEGDGPSLLDLEESNVGVGSM